MKVEPDEVSTRKILKKKVIFEYPYGLWLAEDMNDVNGNVTYRIRLYVRACRLVTATSSSPGMGEGGDR